MTAKAKSAGVPPALISSKDMADYLGLGRTAWFVLKSRGDLPPPLYLPGSKRPHWRRQDIDAWLARLAGDAPPTGGRR